MGVTDFPTPALVVNAGLLQKNIAAMACHVDALGVNLRPHFKTSKMIEVAALQAEAGCVGFTCATPSEIEVLLGAGFDDLLWAFPPVGDDRIQFAVEANRRAKVTLSLDSLESAVPVSQAATAQGMVIPFLIDVDTGLRRCGVAPAQVVPLAQALSQLEGLRLQGIMTHEGHLAGFPDRTQLEEAGRTVGKVMTDVAGQLRDAGFDISVVSVGSTPGVTTSPTVGGISEARPGTYIFYDANQIFLGSNRVQDCALEVHARIVSCPTRDSAIIDAGLKAMSSDPAVGGWGMGRILTDDGLIDDSVRFEKANEEHGFLFGPGVGERRLGERVRIVPNHACGTVNMWSSARVILDDGSTAEWPIVARH